MVGRASFILPLSFLSNLSRSETNEKVGIKQEFTVWWARLMHGVVFVALAYTKVYEVYELGSGVMNKVSVFRGSKEMGKDRVFGSVRVWRRWQESWQCAGTRVSGTEPYRILVLPSSHSLLSMLLEELRTDQSPVAPGNRSLRCSRVALSVAACLLLGLLAWYWCSYCSLSRASFQSRSWFGKQANVLLNIDHSRYDSLYWQEELIPFFQAATLPRSTPWSRAPTRSLRSRSRPSLERLMTISTSLQML